MNEIKVSIIIPSYKPKEYIYECIDSINKQNPSILQQIEVLIVLNGDKEPYFSSIYNYLKECHQNFSIAYIDEQGVSFARNFGLSIARGTSIIFLDDDDFISDSFLESIFKYRHKEGTILVAQFVKYFEETGEEYMDYMTNSYNRLKANDKEKFSLLSYSKFLSSCCGKVIPKDIILNCRFNTTLKISEDALFMFEISHRIKNIELSNKNVIYYRRVRQGSALRQKRNRVELFKNFYKVSFRFIHVYFSSPREYSLVFFINRLLAVFKFFVLNLLKR